MSREGERRRKKYALLGAISSKRSKRENFLIVLRKARDNFLSERLNRLPARRSLSLRSENATLKSPPIINAEGGNLESLVKRVVRKKNYLRYAGHINTAEG